MGKGLTDGMDTLSVLINALIGIGITALLAIIVVGVFSNSVTSGDIPISASAVANVTAVEGQVNEGVETAMSNIGLIFGLVALVVILVIFSIFRSGRKSKGSGDNSF